MSEDAEFPFAADSGRLLELERFLHKELSRFDLSLRELLIALTILKLSYGKNRQYVKIPKLSIFRDLTGIAEGHVTATLERLHLKRILNCEIRDNAPAYNLTFLSEHWQAAPRISRERMEHALSLVEAFNRPKPAEETGQGKTREDGFKKVIEASHNFLMTGDKIVSAPAHPTRVR